MENMVSRLYSFYKDKRVLVTGHTGFKGSWLVTMLKELDADITGYSLNPTDKPNLFEEAKAYEGIRSVIGDIRDYDMLFDTFIAAKPEIVFHLAAQPIVREGYREPRYTYDTNVMGTVNVCECIRNSDGVRSFVNVTTDKVYKNIESGKAFTEEDMLDGIDPYSNSKSCSELVTHSYKTSFLEEKGVAVSCARAGNVIGGGDFAPDRIIPDCVRAAIRNEGIAIRNPNSVRPYQHVLEPLYAYLVIAMEQYVNIEKASEYNVGPDGECVTTGEMAKIFCDSWGDGVFYEYKPDNGPREAGYLALECDKLFRTFGIKPKWNIEAAVKNSVEWYKGYAAGEDVTEIMRKQIKEYFGEENV